MTVSRRTALLLAIAGGFAALAVVGALVGPRVFSTDPSATPAVADAPIEWTGPVRAGGDRAAVEALGPDPQQGGLAWSEPTDVAPSWADIARVEVQPDSQQWRVRLGGDPPDREALMQAGQIFAFGLVIDTTDDGVADYVVGIGTDAEGASVHVWLTDLATGKTRERFSGPYGDPFDFATSFESAGDDPFAMAAGGTFFNVGFAPPELFDHRTNRFYAWASLTEDGEVVAWDYAPDAGWLGATPRSRLGCEPLACPMTGPAPGPGAREWVISVENRDSQDAYIFVASDEHPMGELVGTAVPPLVRPGATERVVFTVPAGAGWAIFVNPTETLGPIIIAPDVPSDVTGVLPVTISVGPGGAPGVGMPAPLPPGWFGN